MSYPIDPKSIQVRDRVVEVLGDIVEGDDFFKTPGAVCDNWKHWKEVDTFPTYEVWFGPGEPLLNRAGLMAEETFTFIVHGRIRNDEDAPGEVRKCIRDVRKALMDDRVSGVSDSLGELCLMLKIGRTETDNGQESASGFGWFNQEFLCTVSGAIEDL